MKKKVIVSILCIAALFVLIFIWSKGRNVRILENLDIKTVSKVVIYNGGRYITITEQEDIKKVTDVLQSMRLNKAFPNGRDGSVFVIRIYNQNGDTNSVSITASYIVADGSYYKCDRDYCDDFLKLYKELSE